MLETLEQAFVDKEAKHNELVSEYNKRIESKKKIEEELVEIEKQIIHNQGAMTAINELAESIMNSQQTEEATASDDVEPEVVISEV